MRKSAAIVVGVVEELALTIDVQVAIRAARTIGIDGIIWAKVLAATVVSVQDGKLDGLAEGSEECKSESSLHFVVLVVELCFYFINHCKNGALIYQVSLQIR